MWKSQKPTEEEQLGFNFKLGMAWYQSAKLYGLTEAMKYQLTKMKTIKTKALLLGYDVSEMVLPKEEVQP